MIAATAKEADVVGLFNDLEQYLLQEWGREGRMGWGMITSFIELGREHGKDKLYDAITIAAQANVRSYRYVRGILVKSNPGTAQPKSETKEHGFVEIVCSCAVSGMVRRVDLLNNHERNWICVHCRTVHAVKTMLEKESNGRIILIQSQEKQS